MARCTVDPEPLVSVTPANVHFTLSNTDNDSTTRMILVRSTDKRPFRILSVKSEGAVVASAGGEGSVPTDRSPLHQLRLQYLRTPGGSGVIEAGSVAIEIDLDGGQVVRIPWSALRVRGGKE